jgi:hypothetical protein
MSDAELIEKLSQHIQLVEDSGDTISNSVLLEIVNIVREHDEPTVFATRKELRDIQRAKTIERILAAVDEAGVMKTVKKAPPSKWVRRKDVKEAIKEVGDE